VRVQLVVIGEMAVERLRCGGRFPFRFGRQPRLVPPRAGVGFVIAEVADRRMRIQRAPAAQGVFTLQVVVPVQRVLPAFGLAQGPAFTEPPARIAVAAGVDEGAVLAVAERAISECVCRQQHAMRRRFVVVGKGGVLRPARCAQGDDAFVLRHPALCAGHAGHRRQVFAVRRLQRIAPQRVLDVGQQQFLVLLFVLQAQLQVLQCLFAEIAIGQARQHLLIDVPAIVAHLLQRGPRQQAAAWAGMGGAEALVVAVEQEIPGRIPRLVATHAGQHEAFEEPGGVGQVPFGRAGIVHALQHRVFSAERCGQLLAAPTHVGEVAGEFTLRGSDGEGCAVHGHQLRLLRVSAMSSHRSSAFTSRPFKNPAPTPLTAVLRPCSDRAGIAACPIIRSASLRITCSCCPPCWSRWCCGPPWATRMSAAPASVCCPGCWPAWDRGWR